MTTTEEEQYPRLTESSTHFTDLSNTPPETERDDNDETAVEDLKVLESQEVFDDEGGDEDNNGEAVDGDYAESIKDLANEVVELIEKAVNQWLGRGYKKQEREDLREVNHSSPSK
ncbi:hypothetical protein BGZ67_009082 [Mortierella alpina]|nr:hypothetical protein BGZ67_009082 [Mortierella alpina]